MTGCKSKFPYLVFQIFKYNSALAGHLHVVSVYINNLLHLRAIQHDRIFYDCLKPSLRGRMAGTRDHVDSIGIGKSQHFRYLFFVLHKYNGRRQRIGKYFIIAFVFPEPVIRTFLQYLYVGHNPFRPTNLN